ncbi:GNAT family N-acetyltransferase [Flavobacterium sp. TAB 87]|uniref:GNAT family N-acetyltransferase n=1 Tax=Flavobacterium sp. TAB 87 TaxID=1729581 RepID=UPI00076BD647|nr:GNAT family N-acetyltransferase [Flavobacterium sp. TAB 87]KVV16344.1 putative acetyltransferase [Flavobacterium sp. TAB 87]
MIIRLATPADVPSILPLFKELDAKHYENCADVNKEISDKRYFILFDNFFRQNSNLIINVAEEDDKILAFALSKMTVIKDNLLFADSVIAEIFYLAVDKNFKRRGIGALIMSDMEDRLRSQGVVRCEARTFSFNDETIPQKINYKPKYTVFEKYL